MVGTESFRLAALVAPGLLALPALAQHAGDVALRVRGGVIETGLLPQGAPPEYPWRVFGAEFGEFVPDFTDEPGFDSGAGALAPGSSIGFRVRSPLRMWDGASFPSSAAGATMRIEFGGVLQVDTPGAGGVEGFSLPVGSNGQWHRHLEYTLLPPAGVGVYLLELELWSDQPGVGASAPFWIVFNQGEGEGVHDAAVGWARCALAGECPCDPDVNQDGNVDQGDVAYLVNVVGGGDNPGGVDPDFNRDGNADQGDVSALVDVVAGGACP